MAKFIYFLWQIYDKKLRLIMFSVNWSMRDPSLLTIIKIIYKSNLYGKISSLFYMYYIKKFKKKSKVEMIFQIILWKNTMNASWWLSKPYCVKCNFANVFLEFRWKFYKIEWWTVRYLKVTWCLARRCSVQNWPCICCYRFTHCFGYDIAIFLHEKFFRCITDFQ